MSSLHDVNVKALKAQYGLEVFVETGCYMGDALRHARSCGFDERWSCDVNPAHIEMSLAYGNVVLAESVEFLRTVVPEIANRRTLFWLDAHYPEDYGGTGTTWPLMDELRILATKQGIENDVIVCDDMQVISDKANPCFNHIIKAEHQAHVKLEEMYALFPLKHFLSRLGTGILVFSPGELHGCE